MGDELLYCCDYCIEALWLQTLCLLVEYHVENWFVILNQRGYSTTILTSSIEESSKEIYERSRNYALCFDMNDLTFDALNSLQLRDIRHSQNEVGIKTLTIRSLMVIICRRKQLLATRLHYYYKSDYTKSFGFVSNCTWNGNLHLKITK